MDAITTQRALYPSMSLCILRVEEVLMVTTYHVGVKFHW